MSNEHAETVLLTGAGFTHNFEGFLAQEMWAEIFNHPEIQSRPAIRDLMINDFHFDYERIYHYVLRKSDKDEFTDDDKEALKTSVLKAYEHLDEVVRHYDRNQNHDFTHAVIKLIQHFASDNNKIGSIFTLNQDIFVERYFLQHGKPLVLPGVKRVPSEARSNKRTRPLEQDEYITLKTKKEIDVIRSQFLSSKELNYIKLHGSFNWKSSDGSNVMVIGLDKRSQVGQEPLLSWYFELFKKTLSQQNRRLLVIGYGFRDIHINEILADSVNNSGLKLYVISVEPPNKFINNLKSKGLLKGDEIIKGLAGYYPHSLKHLWFKDNFNTLYNHFFNP